MYASIMLICGSGQQRKHVQLLIRVGVSVKLSYASIILICGSGQQRKHVELLIRVGVNVKMMQCLSCCVTCKGDGSGQQRRSYNLKVVVAALESIAG